MQDALHDVAITSLGNRLKKVALDEFASSGKAGVLRQRRLCKYLGLIKQYSSCVWRPCKDLRQQPTASTTYIYDLTEIPEVVCAGDNGTACA